MFHRLFPGHAEESTFQGVVDALNAFGGWLESVMNLPRGEGMVFFSGEDEPRVLFGDAYHVRDGHATHEIDDPTSMLRTLQGSGALFKNISKADAKKFGTVLDFIGNSKDSYEVFDLVTKIPGAKEKLDALTDRIHAKFHPHEIIGQSDMGVPHQKNRMTRTTTYRNGDVEIDTLERNVLDN